VRIALAVRALAAAAVLVASPAAAALALASPHVPLGTRYGAWVLRGWTTRPADYSDQGLATVVSQSRGTYLLTRGDDSIPRRLAAAGWQHVGDPDSRSGYILDAYQGAASSATKLFVLTTPKGAHYRFVHTLVPGEAYNNSFAAIAPGGRWFVAGEWGTMRRLLVFALPHPPPSGSRSATLQLAAVISLNHAVRDVQGCAFGSAVTLFCSTNDRGDDVFAVSPQLLEIRLARTLDGRATTASVSVLGPVPGATACQGSAEVEGTDVHGRQMLVSVVAPCTRTTAIYRFSRTPRP
jgi:hypothetical protein